MGLTPGALLFALFCVLWTAATVFVACAIGTLYYRTRRQIDFISLISYVVTVAMSASLAQQIYTIVRWDYIKETERQDSVIMAGKTHFFDSGSEKVVKALYYIQILCYNISGTLIAFWCFFLWANVWPLRFYWWRSSIYSLVTKSLTIVVACILIGVSQIPYFADKHLARFLVGNVLLLIVLAVTPVFLALILYRYIYYRWATSRSMFPGHSSQRRSWRLRKMNKFPKEVGHSSGTHGSSTLDTAVDHSTTPAVELDNFHAKQELDDVELQQGTGNGGLNLQSMNLESRNHPATDTSTVAPAVKMKTRKTFGGMLMLRFLAAILVMSGLEIFHIFFQLSRVLGFKNMSRQDGISQIKEIPITTQAQITDTYMFLPATSQGWLILIVFGTTEEYWKKFKALLVLVFSCGFVDTRKRKGSSSRSSSSAGPAQGGGGSGSGLQEQRPGEGQGQGQLTRSTDNIVVVFGSDLERGGTFSSTLSGSEDGSQAGAGREQLQTYNSRESIQHQNHYHTHNPTNDIELTTLANPATLNTISTPPSHRQTLPPNFNFEGVNITPPHPTHQPPTSPLHSHRRSTSLGSSSSSSSSLSTPSSKSIRSTITTTTTATIYTNTNPYSTTTLPPPPPLPSPTKKSTSLRAHLRGGGTLSRHGSLHHHHSNSIQRPLHPGTTNPWDLGNVIGSSYEWRIER